MMTEEGAMNIRGLGIQDGAAIIEVSMYSTSITDVTVRIWTGDAREIRAKLDLLIQEMESKATGAKA